MTLELNAANWSAIKEVIEMDGTNIKNEAGFMLVHEGDFTQAHKYQSREMVFQDLATLKFWRYWETRSGSPFTDWYYEDVVFGDVEEVERVEVVTTTWKKKATP